MRPLSASWEREMRRARLALARRLWAMLRKIGDGGAAKEKVAETYRPLSALVGTIPRQERIAAGGTLERAL